MKRFIVPLTAVVTAALLTAGFTAGDVALGGVAPAAAQTAPSSPSSRGQRFGQMLLALNLSDDQKSQIRTIMSDARAKNANVTDQDTRRANMKAAFAKVEAVLTPDQRTKLHAEIEKAKAEHGGGPPSTNGGGNHG